MSRPGILLFETWAAWSTAVFHHGSTTPFIWLIITLQNVLVTLGPSKFTKKETNLTGMVILGSYSLKVCKVAIITLECLLM